MILPQLRGSRTESIEYRQKLPVQRVPSLHSYVLSSQMKNNQERIKIKTEVGQSYKAKKYYCSIDYSKDLRRNPTALCKNNIKKYSLEKETLKKYCEDFSRGISQERKYQIFKRVPNPKKTYYVQKDPKKPILSDFYDRLKIAKSQKLNDSPIERSNTSDLGLSSLNQTRRIEQLSLKIKKYNEMSLSEIIEKDLWTSHFQGPKQARRKVKLSHHAEGW